MRHLHTYPPIHTRYNRRARRVQRSYILETKLNSAVPLSLVVYFREERAGEERWPNWNSMRFARQDE